MRHTAHSKISKNTKNKDNIIFWRARTATKTIFGYGFKFLRNVESDNHSYQIPKNNHIFPDFNENV